MLVRAPSLQNTPCGAHNNPPQAAGQARMRRPPFTQPCCGSVMGGTKAPLTPYRAWPCCDGGHKGTRHDVHGRITTRHRASSYTLIEQASTASRQSIIIISY